MREICESKGKWKGGPWECYNAFEITGWESDNVVAVTSGDICTLEKVTRAKRQLIVILIEPEMEDWKKLYADHQKYFQDAADKGLVELSVSEKCK